MGPKAVPPPERVGDLTEPARARPVPFWRYSLAVEPETSPRVLVDARAAATRGLLGAHRKMQEVDVGGDAEALGAQLDLLDLLALGVDDHGHALVGSALHDGALDRLRP